MGNVLGAIGVWQGGDVGESKLLDVACTQAVLNEYRGDGCLPYTKVVSSGNERQQQLLESDYD
jgi:hypothetical protein